MLYILYISQRICVTTACMASDQTQDQRQSIDLSGGKYSQRKHNIDSSTSKNILDHNYPTLLFICLSKSHHYKNWGEQVNFRPSI